MGTEFRSCPAPGPEQELLPHSASQIVEGIRWVTVDDLIQNNNKPGREQNSYVVFSKDVFRFII